MARLSKKRRQQLAATHGGGTSRPAPAPASASPRHRAQRVVVSTPWWQSPWAWGGGVCAVVVVILVVFVVLAASAPTIVPDALAPQSVVSEVTGVSPSTLATVGSGGLSDPLQKLPTSTAALTGSGGKPEVLVVGEDSCPFCAFERWGLVVALSRFGSFSNLHITSSSSSDVYPNTDGFSFHGSSYSSSYVDFQGVEVKDRDGNNLQTPTATEQAILNSFDAPPYSSQTGGLPFIDLGGRYVASGDPPIDYVVSGQTLTQAPELLEGLTWQQIASSLSSSSTYQAQAILGDANYLTAAICEITGNQPGSVCGTSTITGMEKQLA